MGIYDIIAEDLRYLKDTFDKVSNSSELATIRDDITKMYNDMRTNEKFGAIEATAQAKIAKEQATIATEQLEKIKKVVANFKDESADSSELLESLKTEKDNISDSLNKIKEYIEQLTPIQKDVSDNAQIAMNHSAIAKTKAEDAATSEANAKTSELNAKDSETKAKTSETNTAKSEANAKKSELNAKDSETNAKTSEKASATSEANSKASELNAKDSETKAKVSEINAQDSLDKTLASEAKAKTSETNAKDSEDKAKASELNAKDSEEKAKVSEANAKVSETNAKESEDVAKAKALEAGQHKNEAYLWAEGKPVDTVDEDGNVVNHFSSKHYAGEAKDSLNKTSELLEQTKEFVKASEDKASESLRDTLISESNTKDSEDKAKLSEDNAKLSETNAKSSEDNAKLSESNAKSSEDNAKESETKAKESEEIATSRALEAEQYKNEAYSWAEGTLEDTVDDEGNITSHYSAKHYAEQTRADFDEVSDLTKQARESIESIKTSEANAALSETSAKFSQDSAATSESNAATSEANAKVSEINAKDSETSAKLSEQNALDSAENARVYDLDANVQAENAANSCNEAKEWAEGKPADSTADDGTVISHYSSKYYAEKAKENYDKTVELRQQENNTAENAKESADNAADSAKDASKQAESAASSAEKAALHETATKYSENNAKVSEDNAKLSEANARRWAESDTDIIIEKVNSDGETVQEVHKSAKTIAGEIIQYASKAKTSEVNAEKSAKTARDWAEADTNFEIEVTKDGETTIEVHKSAKFYADETRNMVNSAKTSADEARSYATDLQKHVDKAKKWADSDDVVETTEEELTDTVVNEGGTTQEITAKININHYSAKHYAEKAQEIFDRTTGYEERLRQYTNTAKGHADKAEESNTKAKEEFIKAENQAISARLSAESSSLSEVNAKESKNSAMESADVARKWATDGNSPDGTADSESPTGKTQSSKAWANVAKGHSLQAKSEKEKAAEYSESANNVLKETKDLKTVVESTKEEVKKLKGQAESLLSESKQLKESMSNAVTYRGTVNSYSDLPTSGHSVGDMYRVKTANGEHGVKAGDSLVWNGTGWDNTGGALDVDALLNAGSNASFGELKAKTIIADTIKGHLVCNADTASVANSVDWSKVQNKPATYPATAHNHDGAYPSTTGARASGTWSININGRAAVATKADKVEISVPNGETRELVKGTMANTDAFRIAVGGKDDGGWLEIATSDNGTEPIYVRQYNDGKGGGFATIARTATLLDANGNTSFPNRVTAASFGGKADSAKEADHATKASNADNATHATNADNATKWNNLINDTGVENNSDTWIPVLNNGKLQHTTKGNMSVGAANKVNYQGVRTCDTGKEPAGLNIYGVYNNGYPFTYGNLLSIGGGGGSQLLLGWSGDNNGIARMYYRNRRDAINTWSPWKTIAFTDDKPANAGRADTCGTADVAKLANSVAWNNVSGKPSLMGTGGGTFTGKVIVPSIGSSWVQGRNNASIRTTKASKEYLPVLSAKTENGSWDYGTYVDNVAHFSYITDDNFNKNNNAQSCDIQLKPNGEVQANAFRGRLIGKADSATNADSANTAKSVAWSGVTGRPSSLEPSFANGKWYNVGDDVKIGDFNHAGLLGIAGQNGVSGIGIAKRGADSDFASITYDGGNLIFNKTLQANITGKAGSVDWGGVNGRPSSLPANGGTASRAGFLNVDSHLTYGENGLQYFNLSSTSRGAANSNGTPINDWVHVIRMNHGNKNGYYVDLAAGLNSNGLWYRRVTAGSMSGWHTVLDSTNWNNYAPSKTGGGASGTWGISISGNAANADKVDGYHENSFLRVRTSVGKGGDRNTLWGQIGIKEYNDELPDGVGSGYRYGAVASLAGYNSRLDLHYNHQASTNKDGIRYRTGWGTDKKAWQTLLDTCNYNNWVPTKTGGGASGTWGINITGSAGSVDWSKVGNKPAQATRWPSWGEVTEKPSLLGTGGGTMTGTISFGGIGDVAKSAGLTWGGSTDGASIYYQTTAKDQGNLVLNCTDDTNCYIRIAYNGEFKSYFTPSDGVFHGNVAGNASSASSVAWGNVSGKPALLTDGGTHGTVKLSNWIRTTGDTGWYSETYGGGWHMTDTTWIRSYNNKNVYINKQLKVDGGIVGTLTGNCTGSAGSVAWANVTGKPSTFAPSAHNHAWGNITGAPATATRWPSWGEVTGKPASMPANGGNANSVGGWDLNAIKRNLGGRNRPSLTSILKKDVNWGTNSGTGISGQGSGDITLTQPFTNFDAVLIQVSHDERHVSDFILRPSWELLFAIENSNSFVIAGGHDVGRWKIWGNKHNSGNKRKSTTTLLAIDDENAVITDVWGVNY